jgi:hypothetical protein
MEERKEGERNVMLSPPLACGGRDLERASDTACRRLQD